MTPAPLTTPKQNAASSKISAAQAGKPANTASIPAWVRPDLTALLRIEHRPGDFASRAVSLISLPPGAVFARITTPTIATKAYTSVQAGRDIHIELNSDLVYINHSCEPTLVFDMARWEVRVNPALSGGLQPGMELTFFYPSTEWAMAQPFACLCGTKGCLGTVSGARDLPQKKLQGHYLNAHINDLLEEKAAQNENGASV